VSARGGGGHTYNYGVQRVSHYIVEEVQLMLSSYMLTFNEGTYWIYVIIPGGKLEEIKKINKYSG
jgi:hypothetical protein